jgi:transcriptional regulator with PAS, ATPase and Fis domain/tetratricopeptide (TPR) repeat protein
MVVPAVPLEALRGESRQIVALRAQVAQLLAREAGARRLPPVLILGETGTGKGLLARTIHQAGPRRDGPFVGVNCAAIPETLLEAELFGYERGAFTDARHAKAGLFQTAHGGTLLLDEIGLLPAALQAKLLTVLEDRAVRRLGSTRREPVDLALVAATSVELKRAVSDGRFREDLYHRLAVITLELPPLRDRGADILALVEHFLARACEDYGLSPRALTPEAREVLARYRWPGNVRELANAMERAALFADTETIAAASLDFLTEDGARRDTPGTAADAGSLDDTMRARIESALRENGGSIRRTAASLMISRNTLRARMDKYGLRGQGRAPSRAVRGARPSAARAPARADQGPATHWERRHLAFLRARLLRLSAVDGVGALALVGDKVRAFGGRIEESSPTGMIAVFGLEPVDNAPSHAALAALAIRHAAARASTVDRRGADLVMAIHCADHVVGRRDATPLIGIDGKAATWSTLEALVAADGPGTIVGSDAVAPFLTRRFGLQRIQEDGRNAWLVLGREEASAGWRGTRFIGRSSDLEVLRQAASLADQRHGQVVAIVGEAGVGKSRLVHEAVRQLHGWLVLSAGGAPYMKDTSYFPLVELLKEFCHVRDVDTPAEVRERVARTLPATADPRSVEPPILDLLGVLPLDHAFRKLDPAQRRRRTHDAVRQMLVAASVAQPACLVIEDLHWIDPGTQDVLDGLVNAIPGSRVLLLTNYRPEYQHAWSSKSYYRQVNLSPLPVEGSGELLDALLGDDPGLAPLKGLLAGQGNPFVLEETVRMLVETNALAGERGRHTLAHPVQAIEVPPTVQALLAARVDRLPPDDRHLVQVASVVGKDVPFALLQAVADLPDEALRRGLDRLEAAEFLYETHPSPDPEYTFKHALTHEVAYGSLLPAPRTALHARIVGAIEAVNPHRLIEHVERLAHHAVRGELWEQAVTYLRRAGSKAMARTSNREAAADFEQALAALRRLPETRATLEQAIDLRFELRTALYQLGEYERGLGYLREADDLMGLLDDRRRLGQLGVYRCNDYWMIGHPREALESGQSAQAIAESLRDIALQVPANLFLGVAYLDTGDFRRGEELLRGVLRSVEGDRIGERFGHASFPAVAARYHLTWAATRQGRFAEGLAHGEKGIRVAETLEHAYSLGVICVILADLWIDRGEFSRAFPLLERTETVAREWNLPGLLASIPLFRGYAHALMGRAAEGIPMIERTLSAYEAMRVGTYLPMVLIRLGEAYVLAGRLEDALDIGRRALTFVRERGQRPREAEALRLLAEVAARGDSHDDAAGRYREALALAEELGMRPLAAHCHSGLALLYRRTGKPERAAEHLATATAMFRDMGMGFWLEKAEALSRG